MSLDIETYKDANNVMHVYCISFFDGVESKSFFIKDYDILIFHLLMSFFINRGKYTYYTDITMKEGLLKFLILYLREYNIFIVNNCYFFINSFTQSIIFIY